MHYFIFLFLGVLLFVNGPDCQKLRDQNIACKDQKQDSIKIFLKEDAKYTESGYLITKTDSISIPQSMDTVSLFLGTSSSSGYLWSIDSTRSDISLAKSEYISLTKKGSKKHFQRFSFFSNDGWNNKNIIVLLTRPFESQHTPKDSCILRLREGRKE